MAHVDIILRANGVGLDHDVDAPLHSTLTATNVDVTISHSCGISPLRRMLSSKPKFGASIFLERAFLRWLGSAHKNLLILYQERFPRRHLKHLKHIDRVLCKSHHAEDIFSGLGYPTQYIGFTSTDLLNPSMTPDYQSFFHLAVRSTPNGTETISD